MTQLLKDILGDLSCARDARVILLWTESVSAEIARHTEPVKIRNRVLYVNTKSPVWAQELGFLKPEIIRKLNEKAGFDAVQDIRFKAGGPDVKSGSRNT